MTGHDGSQVVEPGPRLLTKQEAAARLGISVSTLKRSRTTTPDGSECYALHGQTIPLVRLSARHVRISSVAIDRAITALAEAS